LFPAIAPTSSPHRHTISLKMPARKSVTIVGGGVIGLSIAWELSKVGHRIRVVDHQRIAGGASWTAAGILPSVASDPGIASEPIEQLRALSHRLYPDWIDELMAASGVDPEFRKCGGLYLARTNGELATMLAQEQLWNEYEVPFERWPTDELLARIDSISKVSFLCKSSIENSTGWFLPEDCTVRPPRLLHALVGALQGIDFMSHCHITKISSIANEVQFASSTHGDWTSDIVCMTAGAWTQRLLEGFDIQSGIMPVRGQMLLYKFDDQPLATVINEGHRYFVPRIDGHVLVGSCEEEVGFHSETSEQQLSQLRSWAFELMPALEHASEVASWAGLRPGSFDGLPYIGRLPEHPQVIVAAGHFRSGIHLAPATAQIVKSIVMEETPPVDISPFHVQRGQTAAGYWNIHEGASTRVST
jgi:glycine oxidase